MENLQYGSVICDMHYGLDLSRLGRCRVLNKVVITCEDGVSFIERIVTKQTGIDYRYHNKFLVVIDETLNGGIVAAYSYDGMKVGFLEIESVSEEMKDY